MQIPEKHAAKLRKFVGGEAFIDALEGRSTLPTTADVAACTKVVVMRNGRWTWEEKRLVGLTAENAHVMIWLDDELRGQLATELNRLMYRDWCAEKLGLKSVGAIWEACGKQWTKDNCAKGRRSVRAYLGYAGHLDLLPMEGWRAICDEPARADRVDELEVAAEHYKKILKFCFPEFAAINA